MDVSVELFFDDDEGTKKTYMTGIRKRIRNSCNPLELPDTEYVKFFN